MVFRRVSLLTDEMITYELLSLGERPKGTFPKKRQQLAAILSRGEPKDKDYGPAGMGFIKDLRTCEEYLTRWEADIATHPHTEDFLNSFIIRLQFLDRRIRHMPIPVEDSDGRVKYEELKEHFNDFKTQIHFFKFKLNDQTQQSSQRPSPKAASVRADYQDPLSHDPINWSLDLNSMLKISDRIKAPSMAGDKTKVNLTSRSGVNENSMLDLSLGYYENIRDDCTMKLPVNSTKRNMPCHCEGRGMPQGSYWNAQIWKWNLKFLGEPDTLTVNEFIRRAQELAKSRGATEEDLFQGASDLLSGSALKWFRVGKQNGTFRNWEELEAHLLVDFEGYDYGDCLLDYIKSRLQNPQERIVNYFATMEDLFMKLNRRVSDELKVKIIRRNLRPEYIKRLGFTIVRDVH